MSPTILGIIPVCALLVGVLLQWMLAPVLSARAKGWLAFVSSLAALGGVLAIWPVTIQGQTLDFRLFTWDGPIALAYHIDGLSQLFALMAAGIGAAVLLYSVAYMARDRAATRFYILMLLFIAGLVNLVYSADLFLMYLSWEAIGLCSFLLVGFWYQQKEAASGARKVLVMTHIAGYGLLAAVLILFAHTGSTLWTDPQVAAVFGTGIFLLMLLAVVAKSVQFPLHTWIPDAMAAPTPVSALLHAACYVKAGVYLIARLHSLGAWPAGWETLVIWIGTITLLAGGLYAMVQSDLKRMLAFSTVSQIGYMMLGLGLGTPLGIAAGLLHCLNHGLFKGGLFLCAGAVQHVTGTRDMNRLGGLARRMPKTTILWLILAGSIAGVPLLSGFVSKWLIYIAALEAGQIVPALISWVVSVITVFYFLKATCGVFLGEEGPDTARGHEAPRLMLVGVAVLATGSIILGVAPQVAVNYIINPVLTSLGLAPVIGISWLGLTAAGENWFATGGLILAIVAVGVGLLVYLLARPTRQTAISGSTSPGSGGIFTGGEPLAETGRLSAGDFSFILHQRLAPFYKWADPDLYYKTIWRILLVASSWLGRISSWLEKHAIPAILVIVLLLALVVGLTSSASSNLATYSGGTLVWPLLPAVILALLALSMIASASSQARRVLPLLAGAGLLAVIGLATSQPLVRLLLLESSAFVAVALVWRTGKSRHAAYAYLLAELISAAAMVSGILMMDTASPQLVLTLLLIGFILRLALVPLYLYLPMVAETTPVTVIGLVIAVIDVSAFGELLMLRQFAPWVFSYAEPWLVIALLSAFGGAVLMLAQRDLKRLLAFSSIQDMGYLLLGVTIGGPLGLTGALIGATVDTLARSLLFSSLAPVETEGQPTLDMRGLATRYPLAGVGFLVGALAVLGVPATMGYLSHWRIFGVAAQTGPLFLTVLLLANALAMLAYARVVTTCWWGPSEKAKRKQPIIQTVAIIVLCVVLLAAGLWPGLLST